MSLLRDGPRTYLTRKSYGPLFQTGYRNHLPIDFWEDLVSFIVREAGPGNGLEGFLAEPVSFGDKEYEWYALGQGDPVAFTALDRREKRDILQKARSNLARLTEIASEARADTANARRSEAGSLLQAALAIPEEQLEGSLFSVGGSPVLITWGARTNRAPAQERTIEVKVPPRYIETAETSIAPVAPRRIPWEWPLWIAFAVMSGLIFVDLVDGCSLFGGTPLEASYCAARTSRAPAGMASLVRETAALESQLAYLTEATLSVPLCTTNAPVHARSPGIGRVVPFTPLPPSPPVVSARIETTELHRALNDRIRVAGGELCSGLEVVASWDEPANVDLRLYCPAEGAGEDLPEDAIVDAYSPQGCNALYDIWDEGAEAGPFLERICILPDPDGIRRSVFATVFRDDLSDPAVEVLLHVRNEARLDVYTLTAPPDAEAEGGVALTLD